MNAEERLALVREIDLARNCSHPIRLTGEVVSTETGEVNSKRLLVACKDRREVVCPACAYLYRADAWILVSTGLIGGKGTPASVASHPRLFVTLTAPSFGSVHTITASGGCVVRRDPLRESTDGAISRTFGDASRDFFERASQETHAHVPVCTQRHELDDPVLGKPLRPEFFDYDGAVLWNAHVSRLWNNTVQLIRRLLAEAGGLNQVRLRRAAQLHYLKVAEVQRRGLVHLHVILRVDGPEGAISEPPSWITSELLAEVIRRAVRRASVTDLRSRELRWGTIMDIRDLVSEPSGAPRVSSYIAKYATKTTGGRSELARRFRSRRQIVSVVGDPHVRRLALAAWDLGGRSELAHLRLRDHAHALGFTGQLITKSRGYSTTFRELREARTSFMVASSGVTSLAGTFHYEGRGYDDPRSSAWAEVLFAMQRELREEAFEARRGADHDGFGDPS